MADQYDIIVIGGGHSYDGHGDRLMARGAVAACASWDSVREELAARGFLG